MDKAISRASSRRYLRLRRRCVGTRWGRSTPLFGSCRYGVYNLLLLAVGDEVFACTVAKANLGELQLGHVLHAINHF